MLGLFLTLALPAVVPTATSFTAPVAIERSVETKVEMTEEQLITNKIKEVFGKDAEVMLKVAFCESGLRQFDQDGQVIKNPKTPDYGVFQLNLPSHEKTLEEMGLDHNKLDDNIKYAKYLFDESGLKPWKSSSKCWQNK